MTTQLHQGHALEMLPRLDAGSVQACITSPPYWGLRDYKTPAVSWPDGWQGSLGLEPTPALYIAHLVAIFQQVKRVLRQDGVLWVNIADSYAGTGKSGGGRQGDRWAVAGMDYSGPRGGKWCPPPHGIQKKSLCLIPQRLAIALQDDGWIIRQVVPWVKRNCCPSSQQDRPTSALEWWLMCVQQPHYYCDMEAVRMPGQDWGPRDRRQAKHNRPDFRASGQPPHHGLTNGDASRGRTYRNTDLWLASLTAPHGLVGVGDELVGLDVPTRAGPAGHYATFSPELIAPLLQMATSARGACSACGAAWRRVLAREDGFQARRAYEQGQNGQRKGKALDADYRGVGYTRATTLGWQPGCACDAPTRSCVVLDPFAGRGTVGLAAQRLGLDAVLIELNASDVEATSQRLTDEAPLLAHITERSRP